MKMPKGGRPAIAIMPIADNPAQGGEPIAPGGADAVTAELYSQAALAGGWQVIPNDDVAQAMQKLPPTTPANLDQNALALGRLVSADGVLYGQVERYKERVGIDYSAAEPAAVTFALKFVDMKTKQAAILGYAFRHEIQQAPINYSRDFPCHEIPVPELHPSWELLVLREHSYP